MNDSAKKISIILNSIFVLLCLISIFVGIGEVSENLDDWHGFTSAHSYVFAIICIALATGASFNLKSIQSNKIGQVNIAAGCLLAVIPLIIHIIAVSLQGNVDSDFQYLMLRNFQGFDKTYLLLMIAGVINLTDMLLLKNKLAK